MLPGQGRKAVVSPHSDAAGNGQGIASDQTYITAGVARNSSDQRQA